MDILNYYNSNDINYITSSVVKYINNLEKNNSSKYLYVYGETGIGKTTIIKNILNSLKYNINYIDSNNNQLTLDELINITDNKDVYSMFFNNTQKNALIIDNINYYLNNDKSYFNNLIKILKKNKIHKFIPFIFINTLQEEKKFTELSKLSYCLKINPPSILQLKNIIYKLYPKILDFENNTLIINNIIQYLDYKFYKFINVDYFYNNNLIELKFLTNSNTNTNSTSNTNNNNIKILTKNLLQYKYNLQDLDIINYSDRTSLSLLLHENIIKLFNANLTKNEIKIYKKILANFIFCDCIDKNIFLYQIWQLNDVTYITKIFYNNFILSQHNLLKNIGQENIIFTKILTKYSSEYNNFNFIFNNTQLYSTNKKILLLHIFIINNSNEFYPKLVYTRFMKLIEQYNNYKISNSSKIIEDNDELIFDESFN
jgi:Cdc6-like AAA superfamily ATPase